MSQTALHRFAHEAMATTFELLIGGEAEDAAHNAAYEAFREIDRLEGRLSRFRMDSDIALANRLKPGGSVPVGVECFEILQLAARIYDATGGAFDVTFARGASAMDRLALLHDEAGFGVGLLPAGESASDCEEAEGLCIDLGGIGKGYALDCVRDVLQGQLDIRDGLIHSGTSTALAWGQMPGYNGWPVGAGGLWGTDAHRSLDPVLLVNGAISGSGTEVKGDHIKDPLTGEPARTHLAAWVLAPTAAEADALSTAFFIMDTDPIRTFCEVRSDIGALVAQAIPHQDMLPIGNWPKARSGS